MPKKLRFKPEIKRVKLNPEQAVLACTCYDVGRIYPGAGPQTLSQPVCQGKTKTSSRYYNSYDAIS